MQLKGFHRFLRLKKCFFHFCPFIPFARSNGMQFNILCMAWMKYRLLKFIFDFLEILIYDTIEHLLLFPLEQFANAFNSESVKIDFIFGSLLLKYTFIRGGRIFDSILCVAATNSKLNKTQSKWLTCTYNNVYVWVCLLSFACSFLFIEFLWSTHTQTYTHIHGGRNAPSFNEKS